METQDNEVNRIGKIFIRIETIILSAIGLITIIRILWSLIEISIDLCLNLVAYFLDDKPTKNLEEPFGDFAGCITLGFLILFLLWIKIKWNQVAFEKKDILIKYPSSNYMRGIQEISGAGKDIKVSFKKMNCSALQIWSWTTFLLLAVNIVGIPHGLGYIAGPWFYWPFQIPFVCHGGLALVFLFWMTYNFAELSSFNDTNQVAEFITTISKQISTTDEEKIIDEAV